MIDTFLGTYGLPLIVPQHLLRSVTTCASGGRFAVPLKHVYSQGCVPRSMPDPDPTRNQAWPDDEEEALREVVQCRVSIDRVQHHLPGRSIGDVFGRIVRRCPAGRRLEISGSKGRGVFVPRPHPPGAPCHGLLEVAGGI